MDAHGKALADVEEALDRFLTSPEKRILHIVTSQALRLPTVQLAVAFENHVANHGPFFVVGAPHVQPDEGWNDRVRELFTQTLELRKALAEDGVAFAEMAAPRGEPTTPTAFGALVSRILMVLSAPLEGVTLVMAPSAVESATMWSEDLGVLLRARALEGVRWILVDAEHPVSAEAIATCADAKTAVDVCVAQPSATDVQAEMLDALEAQASGEAVGGVAAGPSATPPPRCDRPDLRPVHDESAPDAIHVVALREAQAHTIRASIASQKGDFVEAAREQKKAADVCRNVELAREGTVFEIMTAAYFLQASDTASALRVYEDVGARAEASGFSDLAAQAFLGAGTVAFARRDGTAAAKLYTRAAQAAETGAAPMLAIEGYRMAGHVLATMGQDSVAVTMWSRAITLANDSGPVGGLSSAPVAARELARVYKHHHMTTQADALRALADALDARVSAAPPSSGGA